MSPLIKVVIKVVLDSGSNCSKFFLFNYRSWPTVIIPVRMLSIRQILTSTVGAVQSQAQKVYYKCSQKYSQALDTMTAAVINICLFWGKKWYLSKYHHFMIHKWGISLNNKHLAESGNPPEILHFKISTVLAQISITSLYLICVDL